MQHADLEQDRESVLFCVRLLSIVYCTLWSEKMLSTEECGLKLHSDFSNTLYNKRCWLVTWLVGDHLLLRDFGLCVFYLHVSWLVIIYC
jgi:hypothetical protein